jgi:hypothetical protein
MPIATWPAPMLAGSNPNRHPQTRHNPGLGIVEEVSGDDGLSLVAGEWCDDSFTRPVYASADLGKRA